VCLLVKKYTQERKNIRKMSKKYIQKQGKYPTKQELMAQGYEVPGAMILAELIEQEIKNGDIKWNKNTQRYER